MFFLLCALLLWDLSSQAADIKHIRFKDVVAKAQALSGKPYQKSGSDLPEVLKKIGYDEWRDIRFNPAKSLWAGELFSVQFFHLGSLFQEPVIINTIDKDNTLRIPFSPDFFNYTQSKSTHHGQLPDDLGFAGFRVHYPINSVGYADEIISFLGASYFRALGKNLAYGISARGLAVDIAELSGEEFPYFREFWIIKPGRKAKEITFYALLESESLTGAYSFIVRPGEETIVNVRSVLFFRKKIRKLGLAPLTSMFFYGENTNARPNTDFRPEVHDSDGLLIQETSGEWTWHPLINPNTLLLNSFGGGQLLGFGLLQRDINFDHYQDLEARYDKRPSVWITPDGDWSPGHIELLQIPTENEFNDNIGAYWVVDRDFEPGDSFEYAYTMQWHAASRKRSALATIESTRIVTRPESVMFIVEFLPDPMQKNLSAKNISADIQVLNDYRITHSQIIENNVTGGWRLIINIDLKNTEEGLINRMLPDHKPSVELRALLKKDNVPVTETWSYTYLP